LSLPEFAARYDAGFDETWTDTTPHDDVRFVVLDSETTGLDPRKDRLISIGAIAVAGAELRLDDTFEALLRVAFNTASVTVHGVTREQTRGGLEEPEALERFLDYLKDGVIVGHHIGHDVETLNAGYERHFGFALRNRALDTMDLTLHIERDGGFVGHERIRSFTLDALCTLFGVVPHDRHTAAGDAYMTALVFQRLLRLATRVGRTSLGGLCAPFVPDEPEGVGPQ
jgi:DNA polymerase-3 subunit epsilon